MSLEDHRVGKQISEARLERKLSLDEVGSMLGVSPEQVKLFEDDQQRMPAGLLCKLAEIYDLPVTDFFKH